MSACKCYSTCVEIIGQCLGVMALLPPWLPGTDRAHSVRLA